MEDTADLNGRSVPGLFLYDRDCGFCQRALCFARHRLRTRTSFAAWQDVDLDALELAREQTDEQAWLVRPDGRRWAGVTPSPGSSWPPGSPRGSWAA